MPILSTVIDKKDWMLLCSIVNSDRVVRVIFDDRKRDHLAKLTIPGAKPPRDGGVEMILHWEETDDALLLMEKSVRWIKRKLKQEVQSIFQPPYLTPIISTRSTSPNIL
ncbi:hypothetical protein SNOG_15227 [Parastagonospora nodorum SN15]|uniref:Uncharacterized protein n=1 Tax=Phaeosphaeria nodorum (strain SN15 / ATCC MYA-4574 / FGSC 10173) TaxID=321614 RepID=Q0TZ95_PHANO|nr:hypothetical protein SNOG_15227 [Parastagonospora nodorum SN15]EAT77452.1 hypothetical protein SNOG_15227 [Parastagonospora nodorum SN15]